MTKLIPILSGRCIVVELPEGATNPFVAKTYIDEDGHTYDTDPQWVEWSGTFPNNVWYLPDGNWRIIGMLSEVPDAELADVTGFYYNKYNERYVEMPTSAMRATPAGDIEDAIRAEGHLLESPPDPKCGCSGPAEEGVCNACDEWMESQSRVLDRSRCLLLGREI